MYKTRNLSGIIRQITIHGQISFIEGEEYLVKDTKDYNLVAVLGKYKIVGDTHILNIKMNFDKKELEKHLDN
jgi:hypothetical protein